MSTFVAHGGARTMSVVDVRCDVLCVCEVGCVYVLFMFMNLSTGRMPSEESKRAEKERSVSYGLHVRRMKGTASGATAWGTTFGDRTTWVANRRICGCMSLIRSHSHACQHGFTRPQIVLKAEVISLEDGNGVECGIRLVGVLKCIG